MYYNSIITTLKNTHDLKTNEQFGGLYTPPGYLVATLDGLAK